jgi:hypothetical protein
MNIRIMAHIIAYDNMNLPVIEPLTKKQEDEILEQLFFRNYKFISLEESDDYKDMYTMTILEDGIKVLYVADMSTDTFNTINKFAIGK